MKIKKRISKELPLKTGLIVASIILAVLIFRTPFFHQVIYYLNGWGYVGGFFAGMFFISTFTVSISSVVLLILSEKIALLPLAVLAGSGAMVGDLILFTIFTDTVPKKSRTHILKSFHINRVFLFILGALIVASPFPDEVGIAFMGFSRLSLKMFLPLSFILNTLGIFLLLTGFSWIW